MFPGEWMAAVQSTGLWERRWLTATQSFVFILLAGIVLLLLVQLVYHSIMSNRAQQSNRIKLSILNAVAQYNMAADKQECATVRIPSHNVLFDRRGLAILAEVFDELSEPNRETLRKILVNMDATAHISRQMDTQNSDYLVEIIRMAGDMDLVGLDDRIATLMYTHRDNVNLQFEAFLALSKMGSGEHIRKVCMDEQFAKLLSFRSLQQVLGVFTGDKEALYGELLASPDAYVVRICIRRAGIDGLDSLADKILPLLDSDNFNVVIDAARAMGHLGYLPAAQKVAGLLTHERWEVRSVAATAMDSLDRDSYLDPLVDALQDREWQVRYNTAATLRHSARLDEVRDKVHACGDRYALEMLEYMAQTAEIWRRAE